jgi:FAD/FMN-containing dehydrogenase
VKTHFTLARADDMTTASPNPPDSVAMPGSTEEIQKITKLANQERVPLTPFVNSSNVAGLTIPIR